MILIPVSSLKPRQGGWRGIALGLLGLLAGNLAQLSAQTQTDLLAPMPGPGVTPVMPKPAASAPAANRGATPRPVVPTPGRGTVEPARTGEMITLEEAYERTLATDQSISLAMVGIEKAKLLPAAAWVKLQPTISADAGLTRRDNASGVGATTTSDGTVSGFRTGSRSKNSGTGGITLEQPILDFSFKPALRRGKLAVEGAGMDYQRQIRETLYGVAEAYYDVLSQQEVVAVDKEALRLAQEQEGLAETRRSVGEVTRTDVLRARVTVEQARRTLLQDTSLLASQKNILANILNLPPGTDFQVKEPPSYKGALPEFKTLLYRAFAEREDLRSQDLTIRQNEERKKEVRAGYLPRVSAGVDANTSGTGTTVGDYDRDMQANLSLRIPLYSAGQKAIDVKEADLTTQESRLEREQLMKVIEQEVKDAWLDAKTLSETLPALRIQVSAAEQSYVDLQNQYKANTVTSVDVLSALNELNSARKDLAIESYAWQLALRNLERVAGTFQTERVRKVKKQP